MRILHTAVTTIGVLLLWTGQANAAVCGDGLFDDDEQCDDAALLAGDGCSDTCQLEAGHVCRGVPSVCAVTCGDGVLAATEACDDGNTIPGDGCSGTCTVEPGWDCTNPGTTVIVRRRGTADCRTITVTTPYTYELPYLATDEEPSIGIGRWRSRFLGGIIEYTVGGLYSAGYLAMTHSGRYGVTLSGGVTDHRYALVGPRDSPANQLAYVLTTPRAEVYDFTVTGPATKVGLFDDDCSGNTNNYAQYRFDSLSVCRPLDACVVGLFAGVGASYVSGSDTVLAAPAANLFDGAAFAPTPMGPESEYIGTNSGDTIAPSVGSVIRVDLGSTHTVSSFLLWQNHAGDEEGLTSFGLTFLDASASAIGPEAIFAADDCDCPSVPAERFGFPAVAGARYVDLRIIAAENAAYAHLVEARFGGTPECDDGNPCTTDCAAGICGVTQLAAGTAGVCTSTLVCSGPPNSACVECVTDAECSGTTPFCDVSANDCTACDGDHGSNGSFACPVASPVCVIAGSSAGSCIRCTSHADCAGHTVGELCDAASGACGTACSTDADCGTTAWCPDSRVCTPKTPNDAPVPSAAPGDGTCSGAIGARACESGVCSEADDRCGLPIGDSCTAIAACRSNLCAPSGECGECDASHPCGVGKICALETGTCVVPEAGLPDAGTPEAGLPDAGSPKAAAGDDGGCGCATPSAAIRGPGVIALLAALGGLVARRRRRGRAG